MTLKIKKIIDNIFVIQHGLGSNIYLLDFEKKVIIDTGHPIEIKKTLSILKKSKFTIESIDYIINTHSHADHVGANSKLKELNSNVKIANSHKQIAFQERRAQKKVLDGAEDNFTPYNIDILLRDGDTIDLGEIALQIIETPGHTIDSISIYLPEYKFLFSGDMIYYKTIAQLDYYQSIMLSSEELLSSYNKIRNLKIEAIYPGHGSVIEKPNNNIDFCINKLTRMKRNPDILLIHTLTPSAEFYIHKHQGCKRDNLIEFFVNNVDKFNKDPYFKGKETTYFVELLEKMLGIMKLMKIIKEKNQRLYLVSKLNNYIG